MIEFEIYGTNLKLQLKKTGGNRKLNFEYRHMKSMASSIHTKGTDLSRNVAIAATF